MNNRLQTFTRGLVKENPTYVLLLGLCPTLATTTSAINGLSMGLATLFVLVLSNMAISAIARFVPDKVHIPVYIVVIATFVTVLQLLMQAYTPAIYSALGVFIPLIVVNCIVLGRAEAFANKHGILDSALVGFWHADFPVTYVGRPVAKKLGAKIGTFSRNRAFWYARKEYKDFDCIQASSKEAMARLKKNGLPDPQWIPLGCDIGMFSPSKRDEALVTQLKDGNPERLTIFFPHRHCNEKGVDLVLGAYDILVKELGHEPAIVFAGTGPSLPLVQEAAEKYRHIQYIGFVNSVDEMARYYASVDMGLALSGWETFGLSILESMASGNALVGAAAGAAFEHVTESGAGTVLKERTPQALADAIVELYHSDLQAMKLKARAYAEKFSWNECFTRQLNLYRKIAQNKT